MEIHFINSAGHWRNGWFTSVDDLNFGISRLEMLGFKVTQVEVDSLETLEAAIENRPRQALIWANAYYVPDQQGNLHLITEQLENHGLPFVGPGTATQADLIHKNKTQEILDQAAIPIPQNMVLTRNETWDDNLIWENLPLGYPAVLKPTCESGSRGIKMAHDPEEAWGIANEIWHRFPESNLIVEEFLYGDDITCGYIRQGNEILLLPSYYIVEREGRYNTILETKDRDVVWGNLQKYHEPIRKPDYLRQLETYIPAITDIFGIEDMSRIDCRADKNGTLRFFDVNALPGMCYPESVGVNQVSTFFPDYPELEVYTCLLGTLVYNALVRFGLPMPEGLESKTLFAMDSDLVIRQSANALEISNPGHESGNFGEPVI